MEVSLKFSLKNWSLGNILKKYNRGEEKNRFQNIFCFSKKSFAFKDKFFEIDIEPRDEF